MTQAFEFSVVASGLDRRAEDFESRFYEAGCDDATVSFQKGHIILDFARHSTSIEEAIASAVECVEKAGARVDRIEPDPLVNLSEIAERVGITRASVTLYANGQRGNGDFPSPVARVTSDSSLWEWATVARWFYRQNKLSAEDARLAEVVQDANDALESRAPVAQKMRDRLYAQG